MENEELIRQQMGETREHLSEKLECLEQKIVHSVQGASSAVQETMTNVKETLHEGVETAKDAFDLPAHVERRPWLMLGGAVLCGYVLGTLLENRRAAAPPERPPAPLPPPPKTHSHGHGNGHSKREKREAPAAKPEKEASWLGKFEPEVTHLKSLALGVTMGTIREIVSEQVPPHLAGELREVIDAVTKKIGGEPLPSSDVEFVKSKSAAQEQACGGLGGDQPRF